jgi:hypothetical protein
MQTGFEQHRHVGTVVDNTEGAGLAAQFRDRLRRVEDFPSPVALVADLQDAGAAVQKRGGGRLEESRIG